ncbi:unnamed protein product [Thlaspi arvense]|uniref:MADS-box domain-containing protein n=1 Tax=Thlaspi arvense TaxID=13288 RepID=A0AAU9SY30_THLAR|nr:unnamed protein product [Thlaspi arvense]
MVRNGRGRQKIEIIKMSKKSNLQVTFSKRRFGLFKKASELCTLCGAKILMVVFSPGGKVFSFGNPNVAELVYHFLNHSHNSLFLQQFNNNLQLVESRPHEIIQRLNEKLTEAHAKQENEKNKRKFLDALRETRGQKGFWYENDVCDLDLNQTDQLIHALHDVKKKLVSEISQYSHLNVSQSYVGESSGNITPGIVGGRNIDAGLDLPDQKGMVDLSAFNYNPNMVSSNHGPSFGYRNNGGIIPGYNMNYNMGSYNFNQS